MESKKQERTSVNMLVGILESGEILYIHEHHWNGVSCNIFDYLTKEMVEERNDVDNLKDSYGYLWQEAVANGCTELGLDDYMQEMVDSCDYDGTYFPGHDDSYTYLISDEEKELIEDHHKVDIECFECVGGGTGWLKDQKFAKIFNQKVLDQALEHEAMIDAQKPKKPKLSVV